MVGERKRIVEQVRNLFGKPLHVGLFLLRRLAADLLEQRNLSRHLTKFFGHHQDDLGARTVRGFGYCNARPDLLLQRAKFHLYLRKGVAKPAISASFNKLILSISCQPRRLFIRQIFVARAKSPA